MSKQCNNKSCPDPDPEFHKRAASRDGLAARCKTCLNEANRLKYETDEEFRAKKIVQAIRNRERRNAT